MQHAHGDMSRPLGRRLGEKEDSIHTDVGCIGTNFACLLIHQTALGEIKRLCGGHDVLMHKHSNS